MSAPDPLTEKAQLGAFGLGPISRRTLTIALWVLPLAALANVAVLVWSLEGVDLNVAVKRPALLWLAMLLVFAPTLTNSLRLLLWSRFFGLGLGLRKALRVTTGTMIANSVTPSATGGMPIKLAFLIGAGVESRRAITLISFQTAEDALVLFSMVALTAGITGFALFDFISADPQLLARLDRTLRWASMIVVWSLVGLAGFALVVAAGLLGRRARDIARRASATVRNWAVGVWGDWGKAAARGKWIAGISVALAWVQWSVRFSIAGLVLAAFGVEWRAALFWLLQFLVQSISSIVPTPGGAGGAEAGFLLLFGPFVASDILVPAMSMWRLIFFFLPLAGASVIFFALNRRKRRTLREIEPEAGLPHPAE